VNLLCEACMAVKGQSQEQGRFQRMRRKNAKAARNFYESHEATCDDEGGDEFGLSAAEEEKPLMSEAKSKPPPPSVAALAVLRSIPSSISTCGSAALLVCTRCCVGNMDLLDHCGELPFPPLCVAHHHHSCACLLAVACTKPFSLMRSWRLQCANCLNDFCQQCLDKEHKIFDGKAGGNVPKPVCAYCFFTLCARTCKASCCRKLPVKELKRFLARKGVSSRTALEKQVIYRVYRPRTDITVLPRIGSYRYDSPMGA
jgi:hypothetical protein